MSGRRVPRSSRTAAGACAAWAEARPGPSPGPPRCPARFLVGALAVPVRADLGGSGWLADRHCARSRYVVIADLLVSGAVGYALLTPGTPRSTSPSSATTGPRPQAHRRLPAQDGLIS